METGEIIAIVVVVIVLIIGCTFLCFRCWKAVAEVVEDDQKPKRQTFISSMRDSIRRSFRSSMRRMSGIRNSFRRSGGRGSRGKKTTTAEAAASRNDKTPSVATIQALKAETSEIHPSYLKQTMRLEDANTVPRGISNPALNINDDDPTAGFGGAIKTTGRSPEGIDEQSAYPNPLYAREPNRTAAKPSGMNKVRSHLSGYKRMEEDEINMDSAHKPTTGHPSDAMQYSKGANSGFSNIIYKGNMPNKHVYTSHRYDMPFDDGARPGQEQRYGQGQPRSAEGQHSSGSQDSQVVCDLQKESVSFSGTDERNVNAESTYI